MNIPEPFNSLDATYISVFQCFWLPDCFIFRAFDWTPPQYGHLPLLMNADGTKLSKRQGDIKISSYRDKGIIPLALLNFITHSGGGFTKDSERHLKPTIYSMEELTEQVCI